MGARVDPQDLQIDPGRRVCFATSTPEDSHQQDEKGQHRSGPDKRETGCPCSMPLALGSLSLRESVTLSAESL